MYMASTRGTNATYIPSAHVGGPLSLRGTALGWRGFVLGRRGFLDTNMLVSAHVGGLDQRYAPMIMVLHCSGIEA